MLMVRTRRAVRLSPSEQGFTIPELIVAMGMSVVVLTGLVFILTIALRETSRNFARTDATAHARVELELIMNELHSACTGDGVTPIQTGSTGTTLSFTTAYGNASDPTPVEHTIAWNSATGALTDVTNATPPTSTVLLPNVTEYTAPGASSPTPMFQYFAYEQPTNSTGIGYTDGDGNALMMLLDGSHTPVPETTSTYPSNNPDPLVTPLSSTNAASAVEVVITLVVGPTGEGMEDGGLNSVASANTSDEVTDSAVMRLTPAPNHVGSGSSFGPCQ
jgi:Tfp pilus assembly protein PilW